MGTEIATRLAKFVAETKYSEIPREVIDFTKGLTMKTVAGMVAGSRKPSGKKMAKIIRNHELAKEVQVIGCGFKTSLWEAIFLHAFFAHASELEDDRFNGGVFWDITVVPLLFPLAEKLKLSGKALTEALAVGLEAGTRACLFSAEHLGLFIVPGAVGPAAAAARALGLDAKETTSALGLAMSGVPLAIVNFGTDAHFSESSLHSLQGIMAAEMAKEGLAGNPDLATYLSSFLGKTNVAPEKIVEDLGKRWVLRDIWIKKYPCCFFNHRQIDALIELKKQHNLTYDQVDTIEVHIGPPEQICDRPDPKTEGDLQFSLQHVLATAMLDGDVNLGHFNIDAIADGRLKEARSKVKVIFYPDWPARFGEMPAHVTIVTKDGKQLSGERMYPIGSPKEPLTLEQVKQLYAKFTRGILSDDQIKTTTNALSNLENLDNVEGLMDILTLG